MNRIIRQPNRDRSAGNSHPSFDAPSGAGPFRDVARRAVVVLALTVLFGCGPAARTPPPQPSISNPHLNLMIESFKPDWTVTLNEGDRIVLAPADPEKAGTVTVTAGPVDTNINLVAAVHRHQDDIEQRPGGRYFGAQELGGAAGTAFYSRGRFTPPGGEAIEEVAIFGIHPSESRMLQLVYQYPAGDDSGERVGAALELLGLIRPLASNAPQPSTE